VKLASVYMITHWVNWRNSTNMPVLGFIGSTVMMDVGATRLVKRSSIETEWCCATADHKAQQPAQFFIATPAPWKNIPSSSRSAYKPAELFARR
jgi:hypothetical protein